MDPAPQDARLSNYRLERLLGAGGMGAVYLARDLTLDRAVAIKFIAPERAADDSARRRLIREARAAAALDHPNICGVHDVIVEPDGRACIVMQYVEGETLAQVLRRGPLDVRLALTLTADLASALASAHGRGIIHRDLKPQNVIITPDRRAKLLDFGIARQAELAGAGNDATATSLTGPGALIGTPAYMSPEQAQQRPLDGRSDLFSLGAVLYECLTGRRAFEGDTPLQVAAQVLEHDPPAVFTLRPALSAQHDELCRRLLAKHPDDRFRSADELLGALRVLVPDSGRSQVSDAPASRSALALAGVRPFRPRRVAAVTAAVALLAATAVAFTAIPSLWRRPAPRAMASIVGVLPFENSTGEDAHDSVAAGLPEALARRLESVARLRVLPVAEAREAVRENADPEAVARSLGASFIVGGSLVQTSGRLEVLTELVSPDGRRIPAGRFAASGSLLDLHRRLADGVLAALAAHGIVDAVGTSGTGAPTQDTDALAEYSQARLFLERPDVPGNLNHAITLFQKAIERDPQFALAHAGLAEAYWAQYNETKDLQWTGKAVAANLDALRIDPDQPEVRMSLAVMYSGQGRHDEAEAEVNRVLALQPENDNAQRILADIYIARGDWDSAIEAARRAVTLRPGYWRNHSQLGRVYLRAGRLQDAEAAYRRLIELQPDSARGYQALGMVLQSGGRNDEALEQYEKAIAIRPSWGTLSNMGTLYFWRGSYEKAVDAYGQAVALSPNTPTLHGNLGDAYARLGQRASAEASYRRAAEQVEKLLAVNDKDAQQLAALALYRAKLREHRAAREALRKAIDASSNDRQVLYTASIVHVLSGDTTSACNVLRQAVESGTTAEEIRRADELRVLKGCAAYDAVVQNVK